MIRDCLEDCGFVVNNYKASPSRRWTLGTPINGEYPLSYIEDSFVDEGHKIDIEAVCVFGHELVCEISDTCFCELVDNMKILMLCGGKC